MASRQCTKGFARFWTVKDGVLKKTHICKGIFANYQQSRFFFFPLSAAEKA